MFKKLARGRRDYMNRWKSTFRSCHDDKTFVAYNVYNTKKCARCENLINVHDFPGICCKVDFADPKGNHSIWHYDCSVPWFEKNVKCWMCSLDRHDDMNTDKLVELLSKPMLDHIEHWPGIGYYLCRNNVDAFLVNEDLVMSLIELADHAPIPIPSHDLAAHIGAKLSSKLVLIEKQRKKRKKLKKGLRDDLTVVDFEKYLVSKKQWVTLDDQAELEKKHPDPEMEKLCVRLQTDMENGVVPQARVICTHSGLVFGATLYKNILEMGYGSMQKDLVASLRPLVFDVWSAKASQFGPALARMLENGHIAFEPEMESLFAQQMKREELHWTDAREREKLKNEEPECTYDCGGEGELAKSIEYSQYQKKKVVQWRACCSAEDMEKLRRYPAVLRAWDTHKPSRTKFMAGSEYYYVPQLSRMHNTALVMGESTGIVRSPISIPQLCSMCPAAKYILTVLIQLADDWPEAAQQAVVDGFVDSDDIADVLVQFLGYARTGIMSPHHDMFQHFQGQMIQFNINRGVLRFGTSRTGAVQHEWGIGLEALDSLVLEDGMPSDVVYKHDVGPRKWERIAGVLRRCVRVTEVRN